MQRGKRLCKCEHLFCIYLEVRDVLRAPHCVQVKTESEEGKSVLLEVLSASSTIWKSAGAKSRPTATRMG